MSPEVAALIAALGTIATLIGVLVAVRASRLARRVAEAQRVFESAQLRFAVVGEEAITDIEIALPFRPERVVEFPLPWSISNLGDRSASDVLLSLRCNRELRYRGAAKIDPEQLVPGARVTQLLQEENFSTTLVEFTSVHPKVALAITDRISLSGATAFKSSVTAETRDKVRLTIPFEVEYAYNLDCALMYRDANPIARRYRLRVHDTGGQPIREYFRHYNAAAVRRAADEADRAGKPSTTADRWRRFWRHLRPRGRTPGREFVLLYVQAPGRQHPNFLDLPVDQIAPETVKKCHGVRLGAEVFIPAIEVVPTRSRGW